MPLNKLISLTTYNVFVFFQSIDSCKEAGKYCHATLLDENVGGCCDGLECLVDYHPNNAIGTKKCKEGRGKIFKIVIKLPLQIKCQKANRKFFNSFIRFTANFALPPTYLSIEGHKDCMGSRDMGDFTVACLPQIQPTNCKNVAWSWLKQFTGSERIPTCSENGNFKLRI